MSLYLKHVHLCSLTQNYVLEQFLFFALHIDTPHLTQRRHSRKLGQQEEKLQESSCFKISHFATNILFLWAEQGCVEKCSA